MNKLTDTELLAFAVRQYGTISALGRALNQSDQTINHWFKRRLPNGWRAYFEAQFNKKEAV
jgi:hypothetical protein